MLTVGRNQQGDEISIPLPDVKVGAIATPVYTTPWATRSSADPLQGQSEGGAGTHDMNAVKQQQADAEFVKWARDEQQLTVSAVGCNASLGWAGRCPTLFLPFLRFSESYGEG